MYGSNARVTIIFLSGGVTATLPPAIYVREPLSFRDYDLEQFSKSVAKIRWARKEAFREARTREAESTRMHPRSIPESQFDKPTFVRRACGGRWRVMRP